MHPGCTDPLFKYRSTAVKVLEYVLKVQLYCISVK
jgi:hypothetical protein